MIPSVGDVPHASLRDLTHALLQTFCEGLTL